MDDLVDHTCVPVRSVAELELVVAQTPCRRCQSTDAGGLAMERTATLTRFFGRCRSCGAARELRFDPAPAVTAGPDELAPGDTPSALLSREALLAIADDVERDVADEAAARRAIVALTEAAKFPGADLRARRDTLRARLDAIAAARRAAVKALPRLQFDEGELAAHRDWLARGRTGPGRLRGNGGLLRNQSLEGADLTGADIIACRLGGADLRSVRLVDGRLERCNMDHVDLSGADLAGAELVDLYNTCTDLRGARLSGARIRGGDWIGVLAAGGTWKFADVVDVALVSARLGDCILDSALFRRCDLRKADLGPDGAAPPDRASTTDTRFVDCDLRGARLEGRRLRGTIFERCKLEGVVGRPILDGPIHVIECDVTPDGLR